MTDVLKVGINGFGRIGKCILLQLLEMDDIEIKVINTSLDPESIGRYINRDTVHGKRNHFSEKLSDSKLVLSDQVIEIVNNRVLGEINWRDFGVDYLFETSGRYLDKESLEKHKVDYIILSSPPKDSIKMFCYGVNHNKYSGEKIISTASCTTNCIAPLLNTCKEFAGGIQEVSFITIHSATASQSVVDTAHDKKRTNRSIFNNIIPHTTGASKSLDLILPELKGKIKGTSVRIPVSNVSMVDINLRFYNGVTKNSFFEMIEEYTDDIVITVNTDNCVSSDFINNEIPTIIDYNSTLSISDRSLKVQLWYDNEWSYSSQMIRMCKYIFDINKN